MKPSIITSARVLRSVAKLKALQLQASSVSVNTAQHLPIDDGDPDYEDVSGPIPIAKGPKRQAIEKPGHHKRRKLNSGHQNGADDDDYDPQEHPKPKRKNRRNTPKPPPHQKQVPNSATFEFTFVPPTELPGPSTRQGAVDDPEAHQHSDSLQAENPQAPATSSSTPHIHVTGPDTQPEPEVNILPTPSAIVPVYSRSTTSTLKAPRPTQPSHRFSPLLPADKRPRLAPSANAGPSGRHRNRGRATTLHAETSELPVDQGLACAGDLAGQDSGMPAHLPSEPVPAVGSDAASAEDSSAAQGSVSPTVTSASRRVDVFGPALDYGHNPDVGPSTQSYPEPDRIAAAAESIIVVDRSDGDGGREFDDEHQGDQAERQDDEDQAEHQQDDEDQVKSILATSPSISPENTMFPATAGLMAGDDGPSSTTVHVDHEPQPSSRIDANTGSDAPVPSYSTEASGVLQHGDSLLAENPLATSPSTSHIHVTGPDAQLKQANALSMLPANPVVADPPVAGEGVGGLGGEDQDGGHRATPTPSISPDIPPANKILRKAPDGSDDGLSYEPHGDSPAENPASTSSSNPLVHIPNPESQLEPDGFIPPISTGSSPIRLQRRTSALKAPRSTERSPRYNPIPSAATRPRLATPSTSTSAANPSRRIKFRRTATSQVRTHEPVEAADEVQAITAGLSNVEDQVHALLQRPNQGQPGRNSPPRDDSAVIQAPDVETYVSHIKPGAFLTMAGSKGKGAVREQVVDDVHVAEDFSAEMAMVVDDGDGDDSAQDNGNDADDELFDALEVNDKADDGYVQEDGNDSDDGDFDALEARVGILEEKVVVTQNAVLYAIGDHAAMVHAGIPAPATTRGATRTSPPPAPTTSGTKRKKTQRKEPTKAKPNDVVEMHRQARVHLEGLLKWPGMQTQYPGDAPAEWTTVTRARFTYRYNEGMRQQEGWNKDLRVFFVNDFLTKYPAHLPTSQTPEGDLNRWFIRRSLEIIKKRNQAQVAVDPEEDEEEKIQTAHDRRKYSRHGERVKTTHHEAELLKFTDMVLDIGVKGGSDDEEGPNGTLYIKRHPQLSSEVREVMRIISLAYQLVVRSPKGGHPRQRIPTDRVSDSASSKEHLIGLPRNAYDPDFLKSLTPAERRALQMKPDIDLTIDPAYLDTLQEAAEARKKRRDGHWARLLEEVKGLKRDNNS